MYTCKDCLHYNACKSMYTHGLDEYTAVMNYQEDMFDNEHYADVYNCEDFTHKDAWIHLPCDIGTTVYGIILDNVPDDDYRMSFHSEWAIKPMSFSLNMINSINKGSIFLTREEAEDKLKEIKGD